MEHGVYRSVHRIVILISIFSVSVSICFIRYSQFAGMYIVLDYNYYNHFTASGTLSGTTRVSWYQKGKTRRLEDFLLNNNVLSTLLASKI